MNKKKDLNKLSFEELQQEIKTLEERKNKANERKVDVWQIGKMYVIRTVTMIQVGKLVEVTDKELVLEDCAWVADTGTWMNFLKDGEVNEVEPFVDTVIVGRGSIIDATIWRHKVLNEQK